MQVVQVFLFVHISLMCSVMHPLSVVAVSFTGSSFHPPSVLQAFLCFSTEEILEKELGVRAISESFVYSSHV